MSTPAAEQAAPLDKAALLREVFTTLDEAELAELAGLTAARRYPPDWRLCREGEFEDTFYIIADGEVVVTKYLGEREGERVLRRMGRGDYVGEMALIQNAPRAASVRTLTECQVLEMDKDHFEAMLSRSPRLAVSLIRSTLDRMRANDLVAIQELERTNQVLGQLDRNKLEFIEVAAHELRTPLTVMKGYLNVLKMESPVRDNPNLREVLDGLTRGTERLHEIVNTMLDVTRVDSIAPGGVRLASVPVPLKSVVNDLVRRLQHEASGRRVELSVEHAPDTPAINADPTLLQKALYHVLINAIKYTPDGGRIRVRTRRVSLTATASPASRAPRSASATPASASGPSTAS
jgi:signal transduction histidine kinase